METARRMLPKTGFSGLSVRELARRAGVNVAMFHYHFGSKKAFRRRILEETYEAFLNTFREAAEGDGQPRVRLRKMLVAVARFARENRGCYTLMLRELLNAEPDTLAFAKENFPRHISLVLRLLEECRREGTIRPLPLPMLAMFSMSTMGLPNIAVTAFEQNGIKTFEGKPLKTFAEKLLSDEMIETRADMVMAALAKERKR